MGKHERNKVAGQLLAPEVIHALNREHLTGRDDASLTDVQVIQVLLEDDASIEGRHRAD